jgi:predicted nucleic acid-binding protein
MKKKLMFLLNLATVVCMLAPMVSIQAQRLYDEDRDKKAQEAVKLAEAINANSTFVNQLKNLETLSTRDVELYFKGAKRQMEFEINGFRTWGEVSKFVGAIEGKVKMEDFISEKEVKKIKDDLDLKTEDDPKFNKDCTSRKTDIGKDLCKAENELANLKKAVKKSEEEGDALEEELKTRLEKIDVVESLVDKAETYLNLGATKNETIKGLSAVFSNLSKSYVNYTSKLQEIKNQPKDELRLLLQRISVETLQLEADHWKTIAEIQLRRNNEQDDLRILVNEVRGKLKEICKCLPPTDNFEQEEITDTFFKAQKEVEKWKKAVVVAASENPSRVLSKEENECKITTGAGLPKKELVVYVFRALYSAAALAARGETPMRLTQLRLAQEEHRYSIQQSAIFARSYELALSTSAKRLARFYAGGIRPEKIAQLIYTAATVAVPAVIAGK